MFRLECMRRYRFNWVCGNRDGRQLRRRCTLKIRDGIRTIILALFFRCSRTSAGLLPFLVVAATAATAASATRTTAAAVGVVIAPLRPVCAGCRYRLRSIGWGRCAAAFLCRCGAQLRAFGWTRLRRLLRRAGLSALLQMGLGAFVGTGLVALLGPRLTVAAWFTLA